MLPLDFSGLPLATVTRSAHTDAICIVPFPPFRGRRWGLLEAVIGRSSLSDSRRGRVLRPLDIIRHNILDV